MKASYHLFLATIREDINLKHSLDFAFYKSLEFMASYSGSWDYFTGSFSPHLLSINIMPGIVLDLAVQR